MAMGVAARVLIDCEAGPAGWGHVGRMVGLASALKELGASVRMAVNGDSGGLAERAPVPVIGPEDVSEKAWDLYVRDHASPISLAEAARLRDRGHLCLVDDDGPGRTHADVLIGPPTSRWQPKGERHLLDGPEHALVRPEFRAPSPRHDGHVLVTFGGIDPLRMTESVVSVIAPLRRVRSFMAASGSSSLADPTDVPAALRGAALVICSFGQTVIEAATMGVPTLYMTWPHQRQEDARHFETYGVGRYLGPAEHIANVDLPRWVVESTEAAAWQAMSSATSYFDGRGPERCARALMGVVGG